MATTDDLAQLGYELAPAFELEDGRTVYAVQGLGITGYVADSDDELLDSLADKGAHDERVRQYNERPSG